MISMSSESKSDDVPHYHTPTVSPGNDCVNHYLFQTIVTVSVLLAILAAIMVLDFSFLFKNPATTKF